VEHATNEVEPVDLGQKLKHFMEFKPTSKYVDLNLQTVMQTYGVLTLKTLNIRELRLPRSEQQALMSLYKKNQQSVKI
jgi:hypothetical protein